MFLVEKVSRVRGVQLHGLEAVPATEYGAGPLPDTAHLSLSGETVAVAGDCHGMPMLEPNIGPVEISEQLRRLGAAIRDLARGGGQWWRFLNAVV